MRIQFFPEPELEKKLISESKKHGVSVATLVIDVLNQYYGLVGDNSKSETELINQVFAEIKAFIDDLNSLDLETEFDISQASPTFKSLDSAFEGRPKVLKARIGKAFAKEVGVTDRFKNVEQIFLSNGNPKRSVGNRAAMYRIVKHD